jgi:hypothetical protein
LSERQNASIIEFEKASVNLREDAVQACAEQRGVHRAVDVLDAGVGVQ